MSKKKLPSGKEKGYQNTISDYRKRETTLVERNRLLVVENQTLKQEISRLTAALHGITEAKGLDAADVDKIIAAGKIIGTLQHLMKSTAYMG